MKRFSLAGLIVAICSLSLAAQPPMQPPTPPRTKAVTAPAPMVVQSPVPVIEPQGANEDEKLFFLLNALSKEMEGVEKTLNEQGSFRVDAFLLHSQVVQARYKLRRAAKAPDKDMAVLLDDYIRVQNLLLDRSVKYRAELEPRVTKAIQLYNQTEQFALDSKLATRLDEVRIWRPALDSLQDTAATHQYGLIVASRFANARTTKLLESRIHPAKATPEQLKEASEKAARQLLE